MDGIDNVTYLFDKPDVNSHNHESFWASLFAIFLVCASQSKIEFKLPVYFIDKDNDYEPTTSKERTFRISSNLSFDKNIIVDSTFSNKLFPGLPPTLWSLRPDIMILKEKNVPHILVETKTTGRHEIGEYQLSLYKEIKEFFGDIEIYFLISRGHENKNDRDLLSKEKFSILLWEDVLPKIVKSNVPLSDCLKEVNWAICNKQ